MAAAAMMKKQQQYRDDHDQHSLSNIPSSPLLLNRTHYDHAVSVLNRFTIVLDIACLNEGMEALAKLLHLNDVDKIKTEIARNDRTRRRRHQQSKKKNHQRNIKNMSNHREWIGYGDVYEYLLGKNQWDIQLYEYSKTISLVHCSSAD